MISLPKVGRIFAFYLFGYSLINEFKEGSYSFYTKVLGSFKDLDYTTTLNFTWKIYECSMILITTVEIMFEVKSFSC